MTLLQCVPDNVSLSRLEKELAQLTDNNMQVDTRSTHVWALSENEIYGTVQVKVNKSGSTEDLENVRKSYWCE